MSDLEQPDQNLICCTQNFVSPGTMILDIIFNMDQHPIILTQLREEL
jgi:hypothetical protein